MTHRKRPRGSRSLLAIAFSKLRRHRMAVYGAWILAFLYGGALLADFIAPYHYGTNARLKNEHPPSVVHWRLPDGSFTRPYIHDTVKLWDELYLKSYVETTQVSQARLARYYKEMYLLEDDATAARLAGERRERRYPIKLFVRGDPYELLWLIPTDIHLFGVETDQIDNLRPMFFLMGSDEFGRDVFSRLLFGARISLSIGVFCILITFSIGMVLGGASGYFGGWTDILLQRLIEMVMLMPGFYLLLALRAAVPGNWSSSQTYIAIMVILSFIGWAWLARTIRGMVLSEASKDYVMAAKAVGVSHGQIIVRHILPNTLSYAIVAATISIPGYMLGETGLSFLGLGIQEPEASWGNMLTNAQSVTVIKLYPWVLAPGVFIFLAVMAFNFLGDGLRDAFDPKTVIAISQEEAEAASGEQSDVANRTAGRAATGSRKAP